MNKKILKKVQDLKEDDSFLLTVTLVNRKDKTKLDSFVISNNFPFSEFAGTKHKLNELIDEQALTQFDKI